MLRIGIAASKISKGSLLRYNLSVILITCLLSLFIFFMSKIEKTSKIRDPPNLAFFALFGNRYISFRNGETAFLGLFSVGGTLKKRS